AEPEPALLENPIQVPGAATQRQRISGVSSGEEPFSDPVNPVGLPGSRDQVIVVVVHLRNARPGDALEVVNKSFRRQPGPTAGDVAGGGAVVLSETKKA